MTERNILTFRCGLCGQSERVLHWDKSPPRKRCTDSPLAEDTAGTLRITTRS